MLKCEDKKSHEAPHEQCLRRRHHAVLYLLSAMFPDEHMALCIQPFGVLVSVTNSSCAPYRIVSCQGRTSLSDRLDTDCETHHFSPRPFFGSPRSRPPKHHMRPKKVAQSSARSKDKAQSQGSDIPERSCNPKF